jgi:SAM-dependent methyltransferase
MKESYRENLEYIHDVGFGDYALQSAPAILEILDRNVQIREGFVLDLGCGSGLWTQELKKTCYRVLGIDISEVIIAILQRRVPESEFRVGSLFESNVPTCDAFTSIGDIQLSVDPGNDQHALFDSSAACTMP